MIQKTKTPPPDLWDKLPRPLSGFPSVGIGFCLTAAVTAAGYLLATWLPAHGVALVYILAIVAGAVGFGVWTGLAAATLSFLAYNFFFLAPQYTFTISDPRDLFALVVFYGVAVATGSLAGRMREVAERARRRAASLQVLNGFAAGLSGALTIEDAAAALAQEAAKLFASETVVLSGPELQISAAVPASQTLDTADWQAARRSVRNMQTVYPSARGWPGPAYEFHPVATGNNCVAVLGLKRRDAPAGEEHETLQAMVRHAAIALDRIILEGETLAARQEAETEKLRSALLSSISHDLKTPLASIQGAVSSLRELGPKMPEETRSDLLLAIEEEAVRLSRFVTNLLDMTRIEASEPNVLRDVIDIQDIVAASVARARRLMPGASFKLEDTTPNALIRGDAILFEHVLFNLLDNAARFAPHGTSITVRILPSSADYTVSVEDRGRGISQKDLPHVFDKFYRGTGAPTGPGTGLGLAICKRVVECMGGAISAQSPVSGGHGTRVTMRFPKLPDPIQDGAGDRVAE